MDRIIRYGLLTISLLFSVSLIVLLNSPIIRAPSFDKLNCLSQNKIEKIKSQPSYANELYAVCLNELNKKLASMNLTKRQLRLIFASTLAQSIAPYGSSKAVTFQELLGEKTLTCASYALLTGHFAKILVAAGDRSSLHFIGFDGGAVGNHAQLIIKNNKESLLLDPTIGLVAKIGFDDLLSGKSVDASNVHIFRQHNDKDINSFAEKVEKAVLNGKYRPSDLLYYFSSIDDYVAFTNEIGKLWNGNLNELILRFPTPAALALKKNLSNQRTINAG